MQLLVVRLCEMGGIRECEGHRLLYGLVLAMYCRIHKWTFYVGRSTFETPHASCEILQFLSIDSNSYLQTGTPRHFCTHCTFLNSITQLPLFNPAIARRATQAIILQQLAQGCSTYISSSLACCWQPKSFFSLPGRARNSRNSHKGLSQRPRQFSPLPNHLSKSCYVN